jgi:hypothetical protein
MESLGGKAHCRSLGYARDDKAEIGGEPLGLIMGMDGSARRDRRDDKGEASAHLGRPYKGWTEPQLSAIFISLGRPKAHDSSMD